MKRRPETFWVIGMIPVILWYVGLVQMSLETYIKFVLGVVILVEVLGMCWMWINHLMDMVAIINQDNVD